MWPRVGERLEGSQRKGQPEKLRSKTLETVSDQIDSIRSDHALIILHAWYGPAARTQFVTRLELCLAR